MLDSRESCSCRRIVRRWRQSRCALHPAWTPACYRRPELHEPKEMDRAPSQGQLQSQLPGLDSERENLRDTGCELLPGIERSIAWSILAAMLQDHGRKKNYRAYAVRRELA